MMGVAVCCVGKGLPSRSPTVMPLVEIMMLKTDSIQFLFATDNTSDKIFQASEMYLKLYLP
jgi:hypothetical protein